MAALLLPLTVLLLFVAVAGGAASAGAAGAQPQVQDIAFETCVGASTEAALSAQDADGDVVLFQLTERPRLGTAEIEDASSIRPARARERMNSAILRWTRREMPLHRQRLRSASGKTGPD